MSVLLTHPGVYIQELPSGVRSIIGVSTSLTAFIGRALRGPVNVPTPVNSYADFNRIFGGLWAPSTLGYAVAQFFNNGGSQGLIVRVVTSDAKPATATLPNGGGGAGIGLSAANPGTWGSKLTASVTAVNNPATNTASTTLYNLTITDTGTNTTEVYLNLSNDPTNSKFIVQVLAQQSQLAVVATPASFTVSPVLAIPTPTSAPIAFSGGSPSDGADIGDAQITTAPGGFHALDQAPIFNLLVIPPFTRLPGGTPDLLPATWGAACDYAASRKAFLIVDPPSGWTTPAIAETAAPGLTNTILGNPKNPDSSAIYFPNVLAPDPLMQNLTANFGPSGTLTGIYAFTDAQRGVWKAPAGIEATLSGTSGLAGGGSTTPMTLSDAENGELNPLGVNCLRSFPDHRAGVLGRAHAAAAPTRWPTQWKYVPVRRTRAVTSRRACTAARNGWCSSRTTSRCGRRSGSTSARSCRRCSARARSRARRRRGVLREVRQRQPPRRTTSTRASSTSSSASRR